MLKAMEFGSSDTGVGERLLAGLAHLSLGPSLLVLRQLVLADTTVFTQVTVLCLVLLGLPLVFWLSGLALGRELLAAHARSAVGWYSVGVAAAFALVRALEALDALNLDFGAVAGPLLFVALYTGVPSLAFLFVIFRIAEAIQALRGAAPLCSGATLSFPLKPKLGTPLADL